MKPIKILNYVNDYKHYEQLLEFLRSFFFSILSTFFESFRTKKVSSLMILIFRKCQSRIFLNITKFQARVLIKLFLKKECRSCFGVFFKKKQEKLADSVQSIFQHFSPFRFKTHQILLKIFCKISSIVPLSSPKVSTNLKLKG